MKLKWLENPWWVATVVMIALTVILICAAWSLHWLERSDEWAGWMQAIGSVEAIIAAVFIAQAEHWNAKQESERETVKRRDGLLTLILPELIDLWQWAKARRAVIIQIQNGGIEQEHTLHRSDLDPGIPVMMDRFADQLILLGGSLPHDAVQVLSVVRSLHENAERTFHTPKMNAVKFNQKDEPERNWVAYWRREFEKLDAILSRMLPKLEKDHRDLVKPAKLMQVGSNAF
jgi:hypothetical protein